MNGNTNIFLGGSDPLLGSSVNFDSRFKEIERAEQVLAQQKQQLLKLQGQAAMEQQAPRSQTPIWDEIDSITAQMSEKEFELIASDDEFAESNKALLEIVQATQLAQLRPIIENSQQGKDILERHLTVIKRLRKSAQKELNKEMEDFKEYTEKYSDMPYAEYQKMKRTKKGGKK